MSDRDKYDLMAGGFIGPLAMLAGMTGDVMFTARDSLAALLRRLCTEARAEAIAECHRKIPSGTDEQRAEAWVSSWAGPLSLGSPSAAPNLAALLSEARAEGREEAIAACERVARRAYDAADGDEMPVEAYVAAIRDLPALLEALRAMVGASTPGPWEVRPGVDGPRRGPTGMNSVRVPYDNDDPEDTRKIVLCAADPSALPEKNRDTKERHVQDDANAAAIATLRNLAEPMIAVVAMLVVEREALREMNNGSVTVASANRRCDATDSALDALTIALRAAVRANVGSKNGKA